VKNILVTGGAGYIGSHTAKALAAAGYQPIVLDNLSTGNSWAVQWGPLFNHDLADCNLIRTVIEKNNIESVVHFAANAYVGESMRYPQKYFDNNVINSLNLLNTMLQCGVQNIVFSSSCATYGDPKFVPISENHPQVPVNPYGDSKLFIEKVLRWFGESHGMRSVCLRYFNAAGADPEIEIGEHHDPETHLIPLIIEAALTQSEPVKVFGTDYPTPDGSAIRDYVHVTDLANAHVKALRYLEHGGENTALNLGTGSGHSVREVIKSVERVTGYCVPLCESPRRAGDPPVLAANANKAKEILDWTPHFINLDEIVDTAWNWHISLKEKSYEAA
jgi:UDP-glucose-4-epimerase GalE